MAASINPLDVKVFKGYAKRGGWPVPSPMVPGYDFSGTISELSENADNSGFELGDAVFGMNFGKNRHDEAGSTIGGAFAEYILVPLAKLSRKPANIGFDVAAAISLAGTTAFEVLYECARIQSGQKILILGGGSAVGIIALQLAKRTGAWVAVTCSERNKARVEKYHPDKVILYNSEQWDHKLRDLDAVLDMVGEKDAFARLKQANVVKEGGSFVSIASFDAGTDPKAHPYFSYCAKFGVSSNANVQAAVATLVSSGELEIPIDEKYSFDTPGIQRMFRKVDGGKSMGKNILEVSDPSLVQKRGSTVIAFALFFDTTIYNYTLGKWSVF